MTDEALDELKRRAYSSHGADALAAQQQIAELEQERADAAWLTQNLALDPPEQHAPSPRTIAGLTALTALALVLGTAAALTPRDSLAVFDRPQTAQDLAAPDFVWSRVSPDSIRWVGSAYGADAYGYPDGNHGMCLAVIRGDTAGASCTPIDQFTRYGITLSSGGRPFSGPEDFTVVWGPRGDAKFFDVPPHEVPGL